jgi:hypothetical protein
MVICAFFEVRSAMPDKALLYERRRLKDRFRPKYLYFQPKN